MLQAYEVSLQIRVKTKAHNALLSLLREQGVWALISKAKFQKELKELRLSVASGLASQILAIPPCSPHV